MNLWALAESLRLTRCPHAHVLDIVMVWRDALVSSIKIYMFYDKINVII